MNTDDLVLYGELEENLNDDGNVCLKYARRLKVNEDKGEVTEVFGRK